VRVEARNTLVRRWVARATGVLLGSDGQVCCEAEGTFCAVPADQFDDVIAHLETETPGGPRPARPDDLLV
jgi:hypothetical protein